MSAQSARIRPDGAGPFGVNDASAVVDEDRSFRALVRLMRSDIEAIRCWGSTIPRRIYPNVVVAWSYRISHWLHIRRLKPFAMALAWATHAVTACEIRPGAVIGPGFLVVHPTGHVIGGGLIAGRNLTLWARCGIASAPTHDFNGSPRLGDHVSMGMGAMVVGPVLVGDGVYVGAGVAVTRDVAAGIRVTAPPPVYRGAASRDRTGEVTSDGVSASEGTTESQDL